MRLRIPRGLNLVAQSLVSPAVFVGVPVQLSRIGKRHGWSAGRPGPANLAGVPLVGAGTAFLTWAMATHFRAAPEGWQISVTPDYLLEDGPYRFSINPMYVGEAVLWAGWTVLFGSVPVAGGLVVLTVIQAGAVRLEERMLHKRWGRAYDSYRNRIPRWLPVPRPGSP